MTEKKGENKKFVFKRKKDISKSYAPYQQLQATEQQLRVSNQQLTASERKLQKANYDMAKRIKELNCLYGLSKLAMTPGLSLPLLFKGLIKIIPQGWQYPDITAARIIYKGEKYKTDNFKKTRWLQSEAIMVNKKAEGMLEIIYLKKKPAEAEGPFLKEERTLLVMITERLGEIISRILEHEQLEAAYQQLAASEQQEKAVNQQLMASEQEIRALEKIWREANNSLEDILVIIDTDRNIVKINAAGLKLIGKKEKDIIGKKCYEVFYGTICLIESCSLKKFMKNGEEGKTDIYVKDLGKHFSIKCSPIFNDKGEITGFIDLIMDITERKLEEEKLLKSEEKYRLIADNSIDVIWKLDLKMAFTYASPSIKNVFGYTVDEWVGSKLFHHAGRKEFLKMAKDAMYAVKNYKEFKYLTFQTILLHKNGTEIPVEITAKLLFNKNGLPIGFQGTTRDITERKKAEKILRESMTKLQLLYDSSSDAIILLDEKGFFDCNAATLSLFGCATKKEFCSRHPGDFSPPTQPDGTDSMSYAKNNIARALKEGYVQFEYLHRRLDGTDFFAQVLLNKMVLGGREVLQARVYDITERKRAEKELAKYRDHLEELVKERSGELQKTAEEVKEANRELKIANRELEAFTNTASHDLKEPLRAIGTFSKILLEDYNDKLDIDGKDYLKRISKASFRMNNLIDDLLSLSRISHIKKPYDLVNCGKLLKETIKQIKPLIEEKKAQIKISDKLPQIFCSHVKMKEVFYNLIVNAIKYNDKETPVIEIGLKGDVFFVKDNGLGIKKEYFDEIFRIFRRLHKSTEYGGGTGVGLSIVKKVIDEHHGRIWLESEEKKGTTFFFTISPKTDI